MNDPKMKRLAAAVDVVIGKIKCAYSANGRRVDTSVVRANRELCKALAEVSGQEANTSSRQDASSNEDVYVVTCPILNCGGEVRGLVCEACGSMFSKVELTWPLDGGKPKVSFGT